VKDDPKGAYYQARNPSRVYRTGDVFVVLEDAPDGTWVGVYPAVPYAAK
jgi:hypothetical protein